MPSHKDTFGPAGWKPFTDSGGVSIPGLFCKELRNAKHGSSFLLLRFEPGARYAGPQQKAFQLTLIEGVLDYVSQDKTGSIRRDLQRARTLIAGEMRSMSSPALV